MYYHTVNDRYLAIALLQLVFCDRFACGGQLLGLLSMLSLFLSETSRCRASIACCAEVGPLIMQINSCVISSRTVWKPSLGS
jgi:hypothetical protein